MTKNLQTLCIRATRQILKVSGIAGSPKEIRIECRESLQGLTKAQRARAQRALPCAIKAKTVSAIKKCRVSPKFGLSVAGMK